MSNFAAFLAGETELVWDTSILDVTHSVNLFISLEVPNGHLFLFAFI